jgi:cellulose synthase operon protein YhjU
MQHGKNMLTDKIKNFGSFNFHENLALGAYFFVRFFLYFSSYTSFSIIPNAALLLCGAVRFNNLFLRSLHYTLITVMAVFLFYYDSYLPGFEQILTSIHENHDIEIIDSLLQMIFTSLILIICFIVIIVVFLSDVVHVYTVLAVIFAIIGIQSISPFMINQLQAETTASTAENTGTSSDLVPQIGDKTAANIEKYSQDIFAKEASRLISMPYELPANFESFDILMVNICSMATDDIAASNQLNNELFSKFDIYFDSFNSATSYSTPATLRLLLSNCGHRTEHELYSEVKKECQLLTAMERIGYQIYVFFDHNGIYGSYKQTLHDLAGLPDNIYPLNKLNTRYTSFDGTTISADDDVFRAFVNIADKSSGQIFGFMNLISLHDGNHILGEKHSAPYYPRLKTMLSDLSALVEMLSKRKRNTMLMIVPEHGAAIRGDKMQIARLREIPTDTITTVPVMVKFFGVDYPVTKHHLKGPHSYLAISELIKRAIENNVFSKEHATANIDDIVTDLPMQSFIAESTNALFLNFKGTSMYKLKGEEWAEYKK